MDIFPFLDFHLFQENKFYFLYINWDHIKMLRKSADVETGTKNPENEFKFLINYN